jgi:putative ABC transport system permease protein
MGGLTRDVRDACRGLIRDRGFTTAAVVMLSLGIAASSAIFAAIQAVVFELPFDDPQRVVTIRARDSTGGVLSISIDQFRTWQSSTTDVFDAVAAYTLVSPVMTGSDAALRLQAEAMTASMFTVLGVQPSLGRTFRDEDVRVVVLSDAFWRSRLGADPRVLGTAIVLDGTPTTVIGVMPAGFDGPRSRPGDAWLPLSAAQPRDPARPMPVSVLARLTAGISPRAAAARLEGMRLDSADGSRWTAAVETAREDFLYQDALTSVRILVAGVVLVLVMACVNVASLLLGRNISRRRELAVRLALGASRWQIVRQVAVESVIVSLAAAVLGLVMAGWIVGAMVPLIPRWFPRIAQIDVDWTVAAFAALVSAATGLIVSIWPAWTASRQDLGALIKSGERGNSGGARRTRTALVIVETTLAMIVLAAAGMLVASFNRLNPTNPGFDVADRTKFSVRLAGPRYVDRTARIAAVTELTSRLRNVAGVIEVSSSTHLPLTGTTTVFPVQTNPGQAGRKPTVHFRAALPNYFASMGMPILKGRNLTPADTASSQPIAVVNETYVARMLAGREPIDDEVVIDEPDGRVARRIVGVVGDVRASGSDLRAWPEVFVPYAQAPLPLASFVVRSAPGASQIEQGIRRTVGEFDATLPVDRIESLGAVVARSVDVQRFFAMLMGAFAAVAVLLAFVGLYSVAAWSVAQRTREIGVRVAVGATPRDISRLVLRYGISVGLTGAVVGASCTTASSRLLESYLYGLPARQPELLAALAIGFTLIVALASYVPARRAMRVDPITALRTD